MKPDQPEFLAFVAAYPGCRRNIKKNDALKAWRQAMRAGATPIEIMRTLAHRIKEDWKPCRLGECFHPYMATFLRGENFDDETEAAADDVEPLPPLIRLIDVNERAYGRAKALRAVEQQNLTTWEEGARLHRHDQRCQMGRVCIYSEQKKPVVSSIDTLIERMRVK